MDPDTVITFVGIDDTRSARSARGPADLKRVTEQITVGELNAKFGEFMRSLQAAFDVGGLQTSAGQFHLDEIQFSAELSGEGEFRLLGAGVGVSATAGLTFVLKRQGA